MKEFSRVFITTIKKFGTVYQPLPNDMVLVHVTGEPTDFITVKSNNLVVL